MDVKIHSNFIIVNISISLRPASFAIRIDYIQSQLQSNQGNMLNGNKHLSCPERHTELHGIAFTSTLSA